MSNILPFKDQSAAEAEFKQAVQQVAAKAGGLGLDHADHRRNLLAAGADPADVQLLDSLEELNEHCLRLGLPTYGGMMGHIINNLNAFRGEERNAQQVDVRASAYQYIKPITDAMTRMSKL